MADWPDLATVKQVLGADRSDKDNLIEAALASAIEGVVADCGGSPVEVEFGSDGEAMVTLTDPSAEEPIEITVTSKLARAALHRAVTVYKGPDAPFGVAGIFDSGGIYVSRYDPIYQWLLKGNRQKFSVS
jgi:hypothetical protein